MIELDLELDHYIVTLTLAGLTLVGLTLAIRHGAQGGDIPWGWAWVLNLGCVYKKEPPSLESVLCIQEYSLIPIRPLSWCRSTIFNCLLRFGQILLR